MTSPSSQPIRIAVVGAGAAGYFAAITAAEAHGHAAQVTLLEAAAYPLAKVLISGGGRCNLTRACFDPRELVRGYPRGERELLAAFHRWQPSDTIEWFEAHGVRLITEADLRIFPASGMASDVVICLQEAAARAGVKVRLRSALVDVSQSKDAEAAAFTIELAKGETLPCDKLIIATGGMQKQSPISPIDNIVKKLGHSIVPPIPSLFSLDIPDTSLRQLAGLTVESVTISTDCIKPKLSETGSLLITHWGLAGPAILRLSAWGARHFYDSNYQFPIVVNWIGKNIKQTQSELATLRTNHQRRQIATGNPFGLPQRLWKYLVKRAGLADSLAWSHASNAHLAALANQLADSKFAVAGKSTNKEEFVTCGGVNLSEIDFKTMQSRKIPNLYFAGEVLDIDGITGGYNLQAAWTTGHLAGKSCRR